MFVQVRWVVKSGQILVHVNDRSGNSYLMYPVVLYSMWLQYVIQADNLDFEQNMISKKTSEKTRMNAITTTVLQNWGKLTLNKVV